jgi:hypothetical protein
VGPVDRFLPVLLLAAFGSFLVDTRFIVTRPAHVIVFRRPLF